MLVKKMLKETEVYEKRLRQNAYSSFLHVKNSILTLMSGLLIFSGGQCKPDFSLIEDESETYGHINEVLEQAYQTIKFVDIQEYESMVYVHDSTYREKEQKALENIKLKFADCYKSEFYKDFLGEIDFVKDSLLYKTAADNSTDGLYHSELNQKRLSIVQIDSKNNGGVSINLLMERNKISKAFVDLYYINDEFEAIINPFYDHAYKYNGFITFVKSEEDFFQVIYTFKDEQMSIQKVEILDQKTLNKEIMSKNTNYHYETDFIFK